LFFIHHSPIGNKTQQPIDKIGAGLAFFSVFRVFRGYELRLFRMMYTAALQHIKPGDWLTLLLGSIFVALLTFKLWSGDLADKAIIRSGGKIFREVPLSRDQQIEVPGPLGVSIISIQNRKARIASDPSPRQYCVRQGWLQQAGEIALCLPNQVSVELAGSRKKYDSLNY
jgi:hypothetical protein